MEFSFFFILIKILNLALSQVEYSMDNIANHDANIIFKLELIWPFKLDFR